MTTRRAAFALLLAGCAQSAVVKVPLTNFVTDFSPLEVGDTWAYEMVDPATGEKTLAIAKVTTREGTIAVVDTGASRQLYDISPDTLTRKSSGTIALKTPLESGATWSLPDGGQAKILEVKAKVEVPAALYDDCIVVEESHPDSRTVTTFARGVGQIRIEVFEKNGQLVARGVLRGYHKAGTPSL